MSGLLTSRRVASMTPAEPLRDPAPEGSAVRPGRAARSHNVCRLRHAEPSIHPIHCSGLAYIGTASFASSRTQPVDSAKRMLPR